MRGKREELYDLRPLTPEDFPGWNGSRLDAGDRLGFARPLWRSLTNRCGDVFADWAVIQCSKYVDPWAQLKACVVVAEAQGYGNRSRDAVAELLLPNRPPEKDDQGRYLRDEVDP